MMDTLLSELNFAAKVNHGKTKATEQDPTKPISRGAIDGGSAVPTQHVNLLPPEAGGVMLLLLLGLGPEQ